MADQTKPKIVELKNFLTETQVLHSAESGDLKTYGKDWTKVFEPNPSLIVFPKSTEQVSQTLKKCLELGLEVVPSGGRTGLAGGAVAKNGEIVLSLEKMNRIFEIDALALTAHLQGGVVTEALHNACAEKGLTWPVDFASKGSSHVAGNIATNAGGVNVIRYGLTRQWVLGLTVALMDGRVLELNGTLEKNNTGFDLRQLFIGTEGTLGIICEAQVKLTRLIKNKNVYLFGLDSLAKVLLLFQDSRLHGPFVLSAYEFFTERCLRRVIQHRGLRAPFTKEYPYYVLLEVEPQNAADSELSDEWLSSVFEKDFCEDGVLAQTPEQAKGFWELRESIAESLFGTGLPHKNDVSLPLAKLQKFCGELDHFFGEHYADWEVCNFGHIGDGNLHINIMKPETLSKDEFLKRTHKVDEDLFTLVKKYRGSISAEHGIGLLKKDFLHYTRTEAELEILREIKKVLDPKGLLNPGKIF